MDGLTEDIYKNKFPGPGECGCWKCSLAYDKDHGLNGFNGRCSRFIVCEECGNKRCPHATDHTLLCTGSNESGQKGSRYE